MIVEAIRRVSEGHDLTYEQAMQAMEIILSGNATDSQIAALATALRMKGESDKEIIGFAEVMRSHALKVEASATGLIDTCGTGGDGTGTFNISTAAAIIAASAGARVAKHHNRSVSSKCGSADVLEALGVSIELGPEDVADCVDEVGVGFMFAPLFHGAMKHAVTARSQIGIRTIFNILGPLTNPAGAEYQLLGVYDEELILPMARVLQQLGCKRAMVVHGAGGLDEISMLGPTRIAELKDDKIKSVKVVPGDFGFETCSIEDLAGGDAVDNANTIHGIIHGALQGPKRNIVVANAGAALYVSGKAEHMMDGAKKAEEAIDSGKSRATLEKLIEFTKSRSAKSEN